MYDLNSNGFFLSAWLGIPDYVSFLLIWLVIGIISMGCVSTLISAKGYKNIGLWAITSVLFNVFVLITAAGMPLQENQHSSQESDQDDER